MRKNNFTLFELLLVIAIIAILITLLLPSINHSKSLARTAVCMSRHTNVNKAITMYLKDNNAVYYSPSSTHNSDGENIGIYPDNVRDYLNTQKNQSGLGLIMFGCSELPDLKDGSNRWIVFGSRTANHSKNYEIDMKKIDNASDYWILVDNIRWGKKRQIFRMNQNYGDNDGYGLPHLRHNLGKAAVISYLDGHSKIHRKGNLNEGENDFSHYIPLDKSAKIALPR